LLPLTFAFELGYQLKPLLERAGLLIPVFGRQLGVTWEFLGVSASPAVTKAIQILLILIGAIGFRIIISRLAKQHEQDYPVRKTWRLLWPVLILSLIYIYLFVIG
ncbi:MAG: hypothetical protein JRF49_02875, partial [Deltaproteobacteria bacterium]|nr:hypothetical protein [Deltaproteobacteria bacterium]